MAVCVVIGGILLLVGPGSCALSCYTAPSAVAGAVEVSRAGAVDDFLDRFTDEEFARGFGDAMPEVAERCGAPMKFKTREIQVSVDAPLEMTAAIRGTFLAGDCPFPETVIELEGNPLQWRIKKIVAE